MPDPTSLLTLALSRPHEAIVRARSVLATRPPAAEASIARQAAGIALRETGEVNAGLRNLRAALRLARAAGDADREVDVLASLGATLGRAGRATAGLVALNEAVQRAGASATKGRALLRRADVLIVLGRYDEALEDLRGAVTRLRRAGDDVWEARSRAYRGFVLLTLGDVRRADADFAVAEQLYERNGQEFEYAQAVNNRGLVAFARGDLPAALSYLDEASHRYDQVGTLEPSVHIDRCWVLLAAGLARDAVLEADRAAERIAAHGGQATKRAELLFVAARAALAAGDLTSAGERAEQARRLFGRQHRDWWAARAELVAAEARYAAGDTSAALLRRCERAGRAAHRAAGHRGGERRPAGRPARRCTGRGPSGAEHHLSRAAGPGTAGRRWPAAPAGSPRRCAPRLAARSARRSPPAPAGWTRSTNTGWRSARPNCARTPPRTAPNWPGSPSATRCAGAVRAGCSPGASGGGRRLLAVPPVRPPDDDALVAELAALRDVVRRLDQVRTPTGRRPRRRLRTAARPLRSSGNGGGWRRRCAAGPCGRAAGSSGATAFDLVALRESLGEHRLVELVDVDGRLHAVIVTDGPDAGPLRRHHVGPIRDAEREVELARFRLRQLAHDRPSARAGASLDRIGGPARGGAARPGRRPGSATTRW